MSCKSNIYFCVPGCTQKGTVDLEGNQVGFFGFPKDQSLRQEWLVKIWRDVGPQFKLTEATKVCSLYFRPGDVKKGIGDKKIELYVKELVLRGFLGELRLASAIHEH